jgi:hypothetical protein
MPRERVPLDWAMTQNRLGIALWRLGERESGTARLEEVRTEMHPDATVLVGRQFQTRHRNGANSRFVRPDQDGARVGNDAEHVEGERGDDLSLRLHHDRHAADDAVTLGTNAKQPASGRRLFELGEIS